MRQVKMSAKDEFKKSTGSERGYLRGYIEFTVKAIKYVPDVQIRLRALDAQDKLMDALPEDVAEELAAEILPFQRDSERKASLYLPQPSALGDDAIGYMTNTSGTVSASSAYINGIESYQRSVVNEAWMNEAKDILIDFANDNAMKIRIQDRLISLKLELGESFKVAEDTYEKARAGPNLVYQGVMGMRNLLQSFWSELTQLARKKNYRKTKKFSQLHRKTDRHRKVVAECLVDDEGDRNRLLYQLDIMDALYNDMSQTDIGKNNLASDIPRMESLHSRWIILLSELVGFIW
jgi:hypothetical protein